MNILLSSVGRRPYLIRWFQEALRANGLTGRVVAADLDPLAPGQAFADDFVRAPRVDDPTYRDWLQQVLEQHAIQLAVSINDFELSEWALLPSGAPWDALVRLSPQTQHLAEDKYAMGQALDAAGVRTPWTWLGDAPPQDVAPDRRFVTKGRFGSASRGLQFTDAAGLEEAIALATGEVTTRQGVPALAQDEVDPTALVIIQERIDGTEYGVDAISDLTGAYAGTLARRKIAMRSGETDRAETVPAEPFTETAAKIATALGHRGLIDLDIMVDAAGDGFVIDVNPRFGGGYPFSHLAGAHVPSAYVAWAAGRPLNPEWLESAPGTRGSKYVEAVRIP